MNTFLVQSLICAFALAGVAQGGAITLANHGFEAGLTGWTTTGFVRATGAEVVTTFWRDVWDVYPFQSTMGTLPAAEVRAQALNSFFGLAEGTLEERHDQISPFPLYNGAGIYQDFSGAAGDTVTMAWSYVAADLTPISDPAFAILVGPDGHTIQVLASVVGGGVEVGSVGHAPWREVTFTLQESGTHRLGFAVTNSNDSRHQPFLFLDDQPGTSASPGLYHTTPIRPGEPAGNVFTVENPVQDLWYGPSIAESYLFELFGDAFFAGFRMPLAEFGFGSNMLFTDLTNGSSFTIESDASYTFEDLFDVTKFRISGIPIGARRANGLPNPEFPINLIWDGNPTSLRITADPSAVPEPSSATLMGLAVATGLAGLWRRRRQSASYAAHSPRPNSSE